MEQHECKCHHDTIQSGLLYLCPLMMGGLNCFFLRPGKSQVNTELRRK